MPTTCNKFHFSSQWRSNVQHRSPPCNAHAFNNYLYPKKNKSSGQRFCTKVRYGFPTICAPHSKMLAGTWRKQTKLAREILNCLGQLRFSRTRMPDSHSPITSMVAPKPSHSTGKSLTKCCALVPVGVLRAELTSVTTNGRLRMMTSWLGSGKDVMMP
jgi:hypothetical protein